MILERSQSALALDADHEAGGLAQGPLLGLHDLFPWLSAHLCEVTWAHEAQHVVVELTPASLLAFERTPEGRLFVLALAMARLEAGPVRTAHSAGLRAYLRESLIQLSELLEETQACITHEA